MQYEINYIFHIYLYMRWLGMFYVDETIMLWAPIRRISLKAQKLFQLYCRFLKLLIWFSCFVSKLVNTKMSVEIYIVRKIYVKFCAFKVFVLSDHK